MVDTMVQWDPDEKLTLAIWHFADVKLSENLLQALQARLQLCVHGAHCQLHYEYLVSDD